MPRLLIAVLIALLLAVPGAASAWTRTPATTCATLPEGAAHPEGITADADGNIYVTTFAGSIGEMFVFDHAGRLLRRVTVAGASGFLLDLAFHPTTGNLLVIDFGNQRVLTVNPVTGANSLLTQLPANAGPNVLTFDSAGNVYISDSFNGAIWRTGPAGGAAVIWKADARLQPNGVPPFGANGLAFNRAGDAMFVCNTANDTVVKIAVSGGVAGAATTFVNSVNGCDGLIIDEDDNLWLAANQGDEIVVVNPQGRGIAKLGDFEGLDPQGAARGLLFPASLVRSGGFIYVTNLALDLRGFNPEFNAVDSQWAADVQRHTIAKIPARIPPIQGLK